MNDRETHEAKYPEPDDQPRKRQKFATTISTMAATAVTAPLPSSITTPSEPVLPLPKILTHASSSPPELITQGAEALLYKTTYLTPSLPCALKHRPSKPYRHPILDARLTKARILAEARVLVKCRREGVDVPAVYGVDSDAGGGWVALEWIDGLVVRVAINQWLARRKAQGRGFGDLEGAEEAVGLMHAIGRAVGRLHSIGVVHGDLTTSNLMLRPRSEGADPDDLSGDVVLIDFGLASQSGSDEDRAVDLYVLERAFGSTHPGAEALFGEVLKAYGESSKGAKIALKRLEEVRMRGRKKSMIG
jgi:TP53 regulating kinase-like protein